MTAHKRKKSLEGWTRRGWKLGYIGYVDTGNLIHSVLIDEITKEVKHGKSVKVRITIEEI